MGGRIRPRLNRRLHRPAARRCTEGYSAVLDLTTKTAPAVHADETPARAAGGTRYVHLACTRYLTCMHTGDRSSEAIDAGQVLPGYEGVIVRDGYAGYGHLTSALHAWCGVHLLRDLKGPYCQDNEISWYDGTAWTTT